MDLIEFSSLPHDYANRLLRRLRRRDRVLLQLRSGHGDGYTYTTSECAHILKISNDDVLKTEQLLLAKLEKAIDRYDERNTESPERVIEPPGPVDLIEPPENERFPNFRILWQARAGDEIYGATLGAIAGLVTPDDGERQAILNCACLVLRIGLVESKNELLAAHLDSASSVAMAARDALAVAGLKAIEVFDSWARSFGVKSFYEYSKIQAAKAESVIKAQRAAYRWGERYQTITAMSIISTMLIAAPWFASWIHGRPPHSATVWLLWCVSCVFGAVLAGSIAYAATTLLGVSIGAAFIAYVRFVVRADQTHQPLIPGKV